VLGLFIGDLNVGDTLKGTRQDTTETQEKDASVSEKRKKKVTTTRRTNRNSPNNRKRA